ncbi:MAG: dihydrolipoamide acetyltransferase family protein [Beutenbergiaceae bacterium]
MATIVRMPEVMANASEATIARWLVDEGQQLEVGTAIADIETEKAVVEFTSEVAGAMGRHLAATGQTVEVGAPIAVVLAAGETGEAIDLAIAEAGIGVPQPQAADPDPAPATAPAQQDPDSPPPERRIFASPLARRLASEHGLELADVAGSGPRGRIVRRDVDAAITARDTAPAHADPAPAPAEQAADLTDQARPISAQADSAAPSQPQLVPLTRMRRTIARRLTESKSTVPHFYLTAHCRVDDLLSMRRQIVDSGTKVSVNDLVVKAAATALTEVPQANAIWAGTAIEQFTQADIAVAVATDGGLMTPVVRGVESLTLTALSATIADLAARARSGRLRQPELEGGSFAVTNLGMYGTTEFTAILNPPQSGILAVGAAQQQPVVTDGELAVAQVMTVTLSADHRVIDGAIAARWLAAFQAVLEHPLTMLI